MQTQRGTGSCGGGRSGTNGCDGGGCCRCGSGVLDTARGRCGCGSGGLDNARGRCRCGVAVVLVMATVVVVVVGVVAAVVGCHWLVNNFTPTLHEKWTCARRIKFSCPVCSFFCPNWSFCHGSRSFSRGRPHYNNDTVTIVPPPQPPYTRMYTDW